MMRQFNCLKILPSFLILLFIFSLFFYGCGSTLTKKSYTPEPIISATELYNAVIENREQAISVFNGKEYSITGTLCSIYTNSENIPFVRLDTGFVNSVDCYFKKNQKRMLVNNLDKGYKVTIHGKIKIPERLYAGIIVENCEFITWTEGSRSYTPSTPSYSRAFANIGDDIILDSNGSFRVVFIAYTKEAFEEKLLYIKANDAKGLNSFIKNSGSFFVVDSGTKAKVIDKLPGLLSPGRRVRIKNGEFSGITGWVGIENCKR